MKFRFTAIDSGGRVLRGVLRAESEEDARDLLLSEDVFAKKLEPVAEEEKSTWAPKKKIKERLANPNTWNKQGADGEKEKPVSCVFATRALTGFGEVLSGQLGLSDSGALVFESSEGKSLFQAAESEVEVALLSGFPVRILRIVLLDGKMVEFQAGRVFANSSAKSIVARFGGGKPKG